MNDARARCELRKWIEESPDRSQGKVAKWLGIRQPAVSGWIRGPNRPGAHLRVALEILTDGAVRFDDWSFPAEMEAVEKVRRQKTGTDG